MASLVTTDRIITVCGFVFVTMLLVYADLPSLHSVGNKITTTTATTTTTTTTTTKTKEQFNWCITLTGVGVTCFKHVLYHLQISVLDNKQMHG